MRGELAAAHRLAGFRLADLHYFAPRRSGAEIVIKANHPVDVGAGYVQLVCNLAKRRLIEVGIAIDESMQDLHQQLRPGAEACDDLCPYGWVVGFGHFDSRDLQKYV